MIVPFFMQSGSHMRRDIPHLVNQAREMYPGIDILVTEFAGSHPLMAEIVADLAKKKKS